MYRTILVPFSFDCGNVLINSVLKKKFFFSDAGSVFRSSYAAFMFTHRSGSLEPAARVQIPVTFNPMNVGLYTQHWEIEVSR